MQEAGFVYGGNDGSTGELLEVDNDVLFREGLTMKGEVTYTPRLLSLDLQGSLGLLPQCGELYGRFSVQLITAFKIKLSILQASNTQQSECPMGGRLSGGQT